MRAARRGRARARGAAPARVSTRVAADLTLVEQVRPDRIPPGLVVTRTLPIDPRAAIPARRDRPLAGLDPLDRAMGAPPARDPVPRAATSLGATATTGAAARRTRRDPRATPVDDGDRPRRYGAARPQSAARPSGRDRVPPRRVAPPRTTAQIRSAEVKAARGLREPRQPVEPAPWERERWIDDGPLRSEARKATERARRPDNVDGSAKPKARRKSVVLAPEVAEDLLRGCSRRSRCEVPRAAGDGR